MKLRRKLLLPHDDDADNNERNQDCGMKAFGHDQEHSPQRACLKSGFAGSWLKRVSRRPHSPPFKGGVAAPLIKRPPFLSGADGVVGRFQQNKVRFADINKEATRPCTNHPGAARHPSLKTEGNGAATTPELIR